jgi:hypothetical protein
MGEGEGKGVERAGSLVRAGALAYARGRSFLPSAWTGKTRPRGKCGRMRTSGW